MSLSHDRASGEGGEVGTAQPESPGLSSGTAGEKISAETKKDETDRSLFDVNMPGVLTRQQLEDEVDLDHWLLLIRGIIVHMEVFNTHISYFRNSHPYSIIRLIYLSYHLGSRLLGRIGYNELSLAQGYCW